MSNFVNNCVLSMGKHITTINDFIDSVILPIVTFCRDCYITSHANNTVVEAQQRANANHRRFTSHNVKLLMHAY